MPNKKNMAARYASAAARRESRRRAEERAQASGYGTGLSAQRTLSPLEEEAATLEAAPLRAAPVGGRVTTAPSRQPVARSTPVRAGAVRAPIRPTSGLASIVDYSYLRGDLQRIALLSISLFIMLVVLNLLLNH